MAKKKSLKPAKRKKALSVHKPKSKTMVHHKKKRRKRTALSATRRRSSLPVTVSTSVRRRRKKKSFLGATGSGAMEIAKKTGAGTLGGAAYGVGSHFMRNANPWVRSGAGVALAIVTGMVGMPFAAAGVAGAASGELVKSLMGSMLLHDGEMADVRYVDPGTLSDSGMQDDMGEPILMDGEGMCYQKDGERSYQAIGDRFSLQEGSNMQSVSMLPLTEGMEASPYALSANPYNLASAY